MPSHFSSGSAKRISRNTLLKLSNNLTFTEIRSFYSRSKLTLSGYKPCILWEELLTNSWLRELLRCTLEDKRPQDMQTTWRLALLVKQLHQVVQEPHLLPLLEIHNKFQALAHPQEVEDLLKSMSKKYWASLRKYKTMLRLLRELNFWRKLLQSLLTKCNFLEHSCKLNKEPRNQLISISLFKLFKMQPNRGETWSMLPRQSLMTLMFSV